MKKVVLGLLSLFLVMGTVSAQTGKKALKEATKLAKKFDPVKNPGAAKEAVDMFAIAFQDEAVAAEPKSHLAKGDALVAILKTEEKASILSGAEIMNKNLAMEAFKAYQVVSDSGNKKVIKKAVKGMQNLEFYFNNFGAMAFEVQNYGDAFTYFNNSLKAYDLVTKMGGESRLIDTLLTEQKFVTAASGYYGGKRTEARPIFQDLYDAGNAKALVYEALFNIDAEAGKSDAVSYLEEGRKTHPDDSGLLFAEINYYLKEGRLDELIDKLKTAIAKEPDNTSIYLTLGSVYDQLSQKARGEKDIAKADEYFDSAMDYYNQTLAKDPESFDAVYSKGALYYNKAASLTESLNALSSDFSPAGTKKYEAIKAEMDKYFGEALPFFQKSEKMNPKSLNTLIALSEIYARQDKLDLIAPIKERIEAIKAEGGN